MNSKRDLAIAYSLKRRSLTKQQPAKELEVDELLADSEVEEPLEEWADLPEEPEVETPESRVSRIMRNFKLSQLGPKSDD